MDDLRFYVLFNSFSVISGRWLGNNDRLCAVGPRLRLERFSPQAGLKSGTATLNLLNFKVITLLRRTDKTPAIPRFSSSYKKTYLRVSRGVPGYYSVLTQIIMSNVIHVS